MRPAGQPDQTARERAEWSERDDGGLAVSAELGGMSVGVVIPSRNRPQHLRVAIDSVLAQRHEPIRVVVVDDGSSPPVAAWLECPDSRVRVVRNERPAGPGAARNQGAAAVDTEWVAFLDDDDRWLPHKLETCLHGVRMHPGAELIVHKAAFAESTLHDSGEVRVVDDPVSWMLRGQPPHVDSVLVRRAAHERVRFDEGFAAAAELDYMVRLAGSCTVVEIDEVLAVHGPGDARSDISLERRLAAREQFHAKHRELFRDPELEAVHRSRLGHLQRRAGRRLAALRAFGSALAVRPNHAAAWKGLAAACLPQRIVAQASQHGVRTWALTKEGRAGKQKGKAASSGG